MPRGTFAHILSNPLSVKLLFPIARSGLVLRARRSSQLRPEWKECAQKPSFGPAASTALPKTASDQGMWQITTSKCSRRNNSPSFLRARQTVQGRLIRTSPSMCTRAPAAVSSWLRRPSWHSAKCVSMAGHRSRDPRQGRQNAFHSSI